MLIIPDKLTKLFESKGFLKYFKNTSWMLVEHILRLSVGLIVGVWVARYLGPENFGTFNYAIAFTAIFAGIARLGIDSILTREIVRLPEQSSVLMGTAFWLKIVASFVLWITIALASRSVTKDNLTFVYIMIIASGMFFHSFEVVSSYFNAKVMAKYVATSKFIQLIVSSVFKIYLVINGKDLIWFVWVVLFDSLTVGITLFISYKYRVNESFIFKFDRHIAKKFLADSWPLVLSGLAITLYMKIDQVMLKHMLGSQSVGLYSAAVRISEVWYFIPTAVVASLFPAIINAKKMGEFVYKSRIRHLSKLMIAVSICVAVPIAFLSKHIIKLLYGIEYISSSEVLMIHVWAGLFVALGVVGGKWLVTENLQVYSTINTVIAAAVNIILNLILIPKMGIVGAAWATLVSYVFAAYISFGLFAKTRPFFFLICRCFLPLGVFHAKKNS